MANADNGKNVFRYRFSPFVAVLLGAGAVLSAAGVAIGIVTAANKPAFFAALPFLLTAVFSLTLLTLSLSALLYSRYAFCGETLVFKNGLIRSRIPVAEITAATYFKNKGKLVLYYKDGTFTVLQLYMQDIDAFTNTLLHLSPSLAYSVTSDPPKENP